MQVAVGNIIEGKVTGITKFGAFVELPDGKTGMVHISEVAATYVKEIRDHLTENQMVKVKVLSVSDDGKVSLSIKRAEPAPAAGAPAPQQQRRPPRNEGWKGPRTAASSGEPATFEDMMSKFKQTSDDKMSDLRKYMDTKRGTSGRKGPR